MNLSITRSSHRERLGVPSAGVGAIFWLAAPWLPVGTPPSFGSIEHLFLSMPLVAVPLALALLASSWRMEGSPTLGLHRIAQRIQPVASSMVLASFCLPKGAVAGALTAAWLAMAVTVAVGGVRTVRSQGGAHLSNVSLLAAQLLLPVGAVWLLLSRLGVGPRSLPSLTVFLAALHFHFSGFASQILIGATGRRLTGETSRLGALHRCVAVGAIAGIPLIATGKALSAPGVTIVGVGSITLSLIGLAVTSTAVALDARSPMARVLLLVSAASVAAGMIIAGIYGAGELAGRHWIGVAKMATTHGLLASWGFTLCGLSAHLLLHLAADDPSASHRKRPWSAMVTTGPHRSTNYRQRSRSYTEVDRQLARGSPL